MPGGRDCGGGGWGSRPSRSWDRDARPRSRLRGAGRVGHPQTTKRGGPWLLDPRCVREQRKESHGPWATVLMMRRVCWGWMGWWWSVSSAHADSTCRPLTSRLHAGEPASPITVASSHSLDRASTQPSRTAATESRKKTSRRALNGWSVHYQDGSKTRQIVSAESTGHDFLPGKTSVFIALSDGVATRTPTRLALRLTLASRKMIRTVNNVHTKEPPWCRNPDPARKALSPGTGYRNLTPRIGTGAQADDR